MTDGEEKIAFAAWLKAHQAPERTEALRELTLGQIIDHYTSEYMRVENRRIARLGFGDPAPAREALASLEYIRGHAEALLEALRYSWGVTLLP